MVDEVRNFREADEICQKVGGTGLLFINSQTEQTFLETHLLQERRIVNPVWLANLPTTETDDNQPLMYSNWLADKVSKRRQPKITKKSKVSIKRDNNSCTEMLISHPQHDHSEPEDSTPDFSINSKAAGAWTVVPCSKRNLIVCQKRQTPSWSVSKLQEELILARTRLLLLQKREAAAERRTELLFASKESEIRLRFEVLANTTKVMLEDIVQKEVKGQLNFTSKSLEERFQAAVQEAQEKISKLGIQQQKQSSSSSSASSSSSNILALESAIPVGFIYLQLPKSKSPEELWPGAPFIWSDVSWTYSGVFFRVLGGSSAAFGEVQDAHSPAIDKVEAKMCIHKPNDACSELAIEEAASLPKGGDAGWSGYVNTAGAYLYEKEAARLDRDALRFHWSGGETRYGS